MVIKDDSYLMQFMHSHTGTANQANIGMDCIKQFGFATTTY